MIVRGYPLMAEHGFDLAADHAVDVCMPNAKDRSKVRFGSLAALFADSSLMAASGGKADIQKAQNPRKLRSAFGQ